MKTKTKLQLLTLSGIVILMAIITFAACPQPDVPPAKTYAINFQCDEGGTATAAPNPAARGKLVTVSASAEKGYKFKAWQAVSGAITLSSTSVNTATFSMPAEEVTIKVEFESIADVMLDTIVYGTDPVVVKSILLNAFGVDPATVTSITLGGGENSPFALNESDINGKISIKNVPSFFVWAKIDIKAGEWTDTVTVTYGGGKTAIFDIGIVVTPKPVSVTGLTPQNKEYDGTTSVTFTGTAALEGIIVGDDVTLVEGEAVFEDKDVGDDKTLIFDGYELEGEDADNYTFAQPEEMKANITPKPIAVSITNPSTRTLMPFGLADVIYNNGPNMQHDTVEFTVNDFIPGEDVTVSIDENDYGISGSQTFSDNHVLLVISYDGTKVEDEQPLSVPLSVGSNYSISGNVQISVNIRDGFDPDRAIPVGQLNFEEFNAYANTANGANRHYIQAGDITLLIPPAGGSNWTAIGTSDRQFTGSFNGNKFVINDLTINSTASHQGMFGFVGAEGKLENIALVGGSITGGNNTGGLAGQNNGSIENSYTTCNVSGASNAGGLAGQNNGNIKNSYTTGNVTSVSNNAGGLVGFMYSGSVQYCYAIGSVSGASNVGGVAGNIASGAEIKNCTALNPIVTSQGGINTVDRISGNPNTGTFISNYAQNRMTVKHDWDGNAGTDKAPVPNLSTLCGQDVVVPDYYQESWWTGTGNWNSEAWDFTDIWEMNAYNLPKLKDTGGVQDHKFYININIEMVQIQAGSFLQGYTDAIPSPQYVTNEMPSRSVTINGFLMGKYEVTREQYAGVIAYDPLDSGSGMGGQENHPVHLVNWYNAVEFCNFLSLMSGYDPVYTISDRNPATGHYIQSATVEPEWTKNGFRLPTEAEWEYACRAGTQTGFSNSTGYNTFTNTWPVITGIAWYSDNSSNNPQEVGGKLPNSWGLYDMHGNVDEWCWDLYNAGYYSTGPNNNPKGPGTSSATPPERVIRGGGVVFTEIYELRSSARRGFQPYLTVRPAVGFRVARNQQ